jgi:hypothetical protein
LKLKVTLTLNNMKSNEGEVWKIKLSPGEQIMKVLDRVDKSKKYSFKTKFAFAMK